MLLMKKSAKTAKSKELPDLHLKVRYQDVAALKPYAGNARIHSDKQITQIAASIRNFGFNNPVLVDAESRIIAGHGRVEAAKRLGHTSVPTIRLDHMSDAERRAYVIADNRLAELAGWDREILKIELQALDALDLDFDVESTGFDTAELDLLLDDRVEATKPDPADEIPPVASGPSITRPGDLWFMGEHRLLCGDARDRGVVQRLMAQEAAQLVFTDPPYNVKIDGHVGGAGKIKHREFAMASGEMTRTEFGVFLRKLCDRAIEWLPAGGIAFICMDWRSAADLIIQGEAAGFELLNLCVWAKTNGGMGGLYRSQHELVPVFKKPGGAHTNNVQLGKHGRNRTNVWSYPGINAFGETRDQDLASHPTVKPVQLVADAILDVTARGDIVLDPFGGSGTTLVAAHKSGRIGHAIELDPLYVDVIARRMQTLFGMTAINAATGQTFEALAERGAATSPAAPASTDQPEAREAVDV
jgi:DNA modification methylase